MKSGKLLIAVGAAFFLVGANAAEAAPSTQAKVNSASGTVHAAAKPQPRAAKSEGKGRGNKRPVQHDAQLDYPQLG
jgi:hypothetical protein